MFTRRALVTQMSAAAVFASSGAVAAPTGLPSVRTATLSDDGPGITLAPGHHKISANMVVRADVLVMPGATIEVAAGKTLTLLGDFQAPIAHVFTGSGLVDLNRSRAAMAYPEWWGAARDDATSDSLSALQACVAAHSTTVLGAADYYISATWKIQIPHRRIWGAGKYWHGPNQGTRIIVTNPSSDTIQLGFDVSPGILNNFLQSVEIRWLEVGRSAPPLVQGEASAAGLRIRYVLNCLVEGVSSAEHVVGVSILGAVRTYIRDCQAFRSVSPSTGGPHAFWGFHFDGRTNIGAAGGNASIYLVDCNASVGGNPSLTESVGAFLQGRYADSYLINFETASIATGIRIDGMASALNADQAKAGHADLHIVMPILDSFGGVGIELVNLSDHAMIDIVDPYLGAGLGARAGIAFRAAKGMTTITGGQVIGWVDADAGGHASGIEGIDSEGLAIEGTKVMGFSRPVVLDRCRDLSINVAINNPAQRTSQPAIWLRDCSRGHIRPRIKGQADAFAQGVALASGNNHLSIDCTAIHPESVRGGGKNILQTGGSKVDRSLPGIAITGIDRGRGH